MSFVPDGFAAPRSLVSPPFALEPLGPQHNEPDYDAWTSSMEHIRATPGFVGGTWPHGMTAAENLGDLERHAADFEAGRGFTFTVLDAGDGTTIGCLYIYPARDDEHDAAVHSWVRASRAELDAPLRAVVRDWLAAEWPFRNVAYDG